MDKMNWRALRAGLRAERAEKRRQKQLDAHQGQKEWVARKTGGASMLRLSRAESIKARVALSATRAWLVAQAAAAVAAQFGGGLAWKAKNRLLPWLVSIPVASWRLKFSLLAAAAVAQVAFIMVQVASLEIHAPLAAVHWAAQEPALAASSPARKSAGGEDDEPGLPADLVNWSRLVQVARPAGNGEKPQWFFGEIKDIASQTGAESLGECFESGHCLRVELSFGEAVAWVAQGKAPKALNALPAAEKEKIGAGRGELWSGLRGWHAVIAVLFAGCFFLWSLMAHNVMAKKGMERLAWALATLKAGRPALAGVCVLAALAGWGATNGISGKPLWVAASKPQQAAQASGHLAEQSAQWELRQADAWDRDAKAERPQGAKATALTDAPATPGQKERFASKSAQACEAAQLCAKMTPATLGDVARAAFGREPRMRLARAQDELKWGERARQAKATWAATAAFGAWFAAAFLLVVAEVTWFAGAAAMDFFVKKNAQEYEERISGWLRRGAPLVEQADLSAAVQSAAGAAGANDKPEAARKGAKRI